MKHILLTTIALAYLLCLARVAHAAEPVFEIGSTNRSEPSPYLMRSLYSIKKSPDGSAAPDKRLTDWTTNLTVELPATNTHELVVLGETNTLLQTLGFFDPVSTAATRPQNLVAPVFIRRKH